ncbi:MAG TPA: tetratricopeptide repeat protein, partial [candidate division Zixibacteria bacterium]|nr:tetratricopeptide repeat protein [candidate division Zixibacteria bacterium]
MMKKLLILLFLLTAGCSQSLYMQGRRHVDEGRYDEAVDILYQEIQKKPTSYEAWRELGVAYYQKGDLIKAEDAFKQANNIQPDARTNLYMGLIFEQRKQYDKAIGAYSSSLNMKSKGKTGEMLRSHLNRLIDLKIREDARQAIADETAIDVAAIPDN